MQSIHSVAIVHTCPVFTHFLHHARIMPITNGLWGGCRVMSVSKGMVRMQVSSLERQREWGTMSLSCSM